MLSPLLLYSLAIYLLDIGEIFLLGYDCGNIETTLDDKGRKITHFYQGSQINHRGIGKTSWYDTRGRVEKDFSVFQNETKIKIYNVSPKSKINNFEKISYEQFFSKLDINLYNQDELRKQIKHDLEGKIK